MSFPPRSAARAGCSNTRWSTRHWAGAWAACCMPLHCRPRHPKIECIYTADSERDRAMSDNPVFERIQRDISDNNVVLYMKGTPVFPQCGFSAAVVQVLTH